jgi:hypothetical protein
MDERIAGDLEKVPLAMKHAPDQRVEEAITLGVAMGDDILNEFADGARKRKRCALPLPKGEGQG